MEEPNRSLISTFWASYATGNLSALRDDVLAADAVWHMPGRHPLSGTYRGVDAICGFLRELGTHDFRVEVLFAGADDSHVVELHHCASGDGALAMTWVLVFRIEAGRIAGIRHYPADAHAADTYFRNR
ncbi:nuclear transport factor 2 family protein [Streptomyces sp. NPDC048332]|uniref:nuclear transport factor 2 family protein n=1 Tax=unclassified Streptomyces TaxID=2593676 RepID=UPI003440C499